jgi:hypothetical protein
MEKTCATCAYQYSNPFSTFCSHPDLGVLDRVRGRVYPEVYEAASDPGKCGPDAKLYKKGGFLRMLFRL